MNILYEKTSDFSLYDELFSRFSDYGPRGYYLLESFIIKLLQAEAESFGQTVEALNSHSGNYYDAIAPVGLGDIAGPVAIEISWSISTEKILRSFDQISSDKTSGFAAILFISLRGINEKNEGILKARKVFGDKLHIWGEADIKKIIDRHPVASKNASLNLFSNRMQIAFEGANENWHERRSEIIGEVRAKYLSGRFSLLLGAGVSSSAGLPDWDTLLNSLFVSMLATDEIGKTLASESDAEDISSIVKRLRQMDGPSAITLARYIRKGIGNDSPIAQDKFITTVTKQLYGLRNKKFVINSALIKAVADLCVPSRTGANVRSVLTYNFDDLIERELAARGLSYRPIFEEVQLANPEELPIYHVHGFLPEDRNGFLNINKSTLVFSEEGYHQIYGDAYHWSNLVQLNSLKETSCLMIGLSLTDPNLRRLLEISAKSIEKPKHFAFMRRIPYGRFSKDGEKVAVRASASMVKRFLERHHKLNEEVMKELGVNIIWYEDHDEIPKILHSIGVGHLADK